MDYDVSDIDYKLEINSEGDAMETLFCLRNMSSYIDEIFSSDEIQTLGCLTIECLQVFKRDAALLLILQMISELHTNIEFEK
jgi:hypothetical protein